MDKEALQRQLEDMEEASERWRAERRRLNAEIDKLESTLADVKSEVARKGTSTEKQAADSRTAARIQEAADQRLKKATDDWEIERTKLNSKISRLEGALAEAIARASNPLRVTQSVKEQFELELNRVAKEKTELEQTFLRARTDWEQEKLKMTAEAVKLRRAAQIMGRPVLPENAPEANPKVRDVQNQLKENVSKWNAEREQLVSQIRRLEEGSRVWDAERRKLSDHASQLQQELTQAEAKLQSQEFAARKPKVQAEELRREIEGIRSENEALQQLLRDTRSERESEQRRLKSEIQLLEKELQLASAERRQQTDQARKTQENQSVWDIERRSLNSRIEQLEKELLQASGRREQVGNEVIEQLRQQYEQRLQEAIQQKTQLAAELQTVRASLQAERARVENQRGGDVGIDTGAVEAEILRVEQQLNEIIAIIENPSTELSTVIRKNVEKAEMDSYLKGIFFTLGRK